MKQDRKYPMQVLNIDGNNIFMLRTYYTWILMGFTTFNLSYRKHSNIFGYD